MSFQFLLAYCFFCIKASCGFLEWNDTKMSIYCNSPLNYWIIFFTSPSQLKDGYFSHFSIEHKAKGTKKRFMSPNNKVDDLKPFVYFHYIILDQGTEDRKFGHASFTYILIYLCFQSTQHCTRTFNIPYPYFKERTIIHNLLLSSSITTTIL